MSSLSHVGKGVMRVAKNYTRGYSDVQAKVRDATSNDKWGPSGTQMNELAQLTYNQNDFIEIMEMLDKRLNDKGKNWRHVFKSLTVLDYLLHAGSENVVLYFRDNIYIIKTLKEFQYIDEEGKDQGTNVRQKAKDITNLLQDASRLQQERRNRASMRDRMTSGDEFDGDDGNENMRRRSRSLPPRRRTDNEEELQRAIEESKRTLAQERARGQEDIDLQEAIRLSEEEEARRNQALANASGSLFDDHSQNASTNGTDSLIDISGPVQPQFTLQPQFTSFNPYQQQVQQEAMQAEFLRQQAEWQQQQLQMQAQQQVQLQAQQQQQQQEEWMRQQQLLVFQQQQQQQQQQQHIMAQPTGFGSNNPFAPSSSPNHSLSTSSLSSFSNNSLTASPAPQSAGPSFNLQGTYANGGPSANLSSTPAQSPPPPSHSAPPRQGTLSVKTRNDEQHSQLANLLANRDDGIDTFGNFGQLRYGQNAGRLAGQPTGQPASHNPFQQQQSDQPFFSI